MEYIEHIYEFVLSLSSKWWIIHFIEKIISFVLPILNFPAKKKTFCEEKKLYFLIEKVKFSNWYESVKTNRMLKLELEKQEIGIIRCILHKKNVLWNDYIAHAVHEYYPDFKILKK